MKLAFAIFFTFPLWLCAQTHMFSMDEEVSNSWVSLNEYLEIITDVKGQLSWQQISDSLLWQTGPDPSQAALYWGRLELENTTKNYRDFILHLPRRMAFIDLKFILNNDTLFLRSGQKVHPRDKSFIFQDRNYARISLNRGESATVYLRMAPHTKYEPEGLDVSIRQFEGFKDRIAILERDYLFFGSIFLAMALFNLLFFFNLKERSYLFYGLFLFVLVFSLGFRFETFKWMPSYILYDLISEALHYLGLILFFLFANKHLAVKENAPLLHRLVIVLLVVFGGLIATLIVDFFFFPQITVIRSFTRMMYPKVLIVSSIFLLVVCTSFVIRRKHNPYYLFGLIALSISLLLFALNFGPRVISFHTSVLILYSGISITTIFFSISISAQLKLNQKEKEKALNEKLLVQTNHNRLLEEEVKSRTKEIGKKMIQLDQSNREKELLLSEIHHRVKNNLQVISSLLKLQSRQLEEGKAKSAVLEGRDRVKAMALIHQRLYQQDQFSAIQMDDYIQNLVENLADSYGYNEKDFEMDLKVAEIHLDVDTAVPLGLIVNELVSNVFKHAFKGNNKKKLSISLEVNKTLSLIIKDWGPGLPGGFKLEEASSFGLQLIHGLAQELNGKVSYENGHGTQVIIQINDFETVPNL